MVYAFIVRVFDVGEALSSLIHEAMYYRASYITPCTVPETSRGEQNLIDSCIKPSTYNHPFST